MLIPTSWQAYGYSVPELKVTMQPQVAVPIASNTKFFTAVALWQLRQQGLLDIDAPVVQVGQGGRGSPANLAELRRPASSGQLPSCVVQQSSYGLVSLYPLPAYALRLICF